MKPHSSPIRALWKARWRQVWIERRELSVLSLHIEERQSVPTRKSLRNVAVASRGCCGSSVIRTSAVPLFVGAKMTESGIATDGGLS